MTEHGTSASVRPKHRSPIYPAIDLETALDRAEQLWNHAQRHFVPLVDAMGAWGYSPKSSGGLQTAAAMKRFGLLEDEGSGARRRVRASDLARAIITDDRDSEQRQERIKHAALLPKIHRELWDANDGSLPPDSALRFHLVNDRAFSEGAARDLIDEFRKTLEFAGLTEEDATRSPTYPDSSETQRPLTTRASSTRQPAPMPLAGGFQLPVGPGEFAVLQGPFPVTENQWRLMLSVLEAMKPGLVRNEPSEDES